ncbi:hypothetical protein LshimejAT787_0112690 [Lyophyllum shimeji]|uniref:Uncharacterized protein n=1 Tax=Lyophyllum shimeji TaxID=47721 RepID=A0A9P3PE82_LYOSH|nr:hypothetical protein LshimejAT787_0112690 [Lyophyllum shimeji]
MKLHAAAVASLVVSAFVAAGGCAPTNKRASNIAGSISESGTTQKWVENRRTLDSEMKKWIQRRWRGGSQEALWTLGHSARGCPSDWRNIINTLVM